jgi:hypothetical protein
MECNQESIIQETLCEDFLFSFFKFIVVTAFHRESENAPPGEGEYFGNNTSQSAQNIPPRMFDF